MEGLLVLALIAIVIIPIVIVIQNATLSGEIKSLRESLEGRLNFQEMALDKVLAEIKNLKKTPELRPEDIPADPLPAIPPAKPAAVSVSTPIWLGAAKSPEPEPVHHELLETATPPEKEPEAILASPLEERPAALAEALPEAPPALPAAPPEPTWLDRLWQSARDYLMRDGHFWVVAGVFVLFLGASFFVRHSIAMGWFPPAMRLACTFAVGLALTGAGLRLRNKKAAWALVVQGCGLALMYLTVVAASARGYNLLGQAPALTVMSVLVVVTALLALWQNSQIVAHLSIVAAFVAPLLVSNNSGNYVGLFSFYTVLNLGILGMCQLRPWRRLYLTGFSLTFGVFGLWVARSYLPPMFNSSVPFLVIFYLFYTFISLHTACDAAQASPQTPPRRFRTDLTLTVMAPILFLSTLAAMAHKPYTLALASALSGLMYLAIFVLGGTKLPHLTRQIIRWQGVIGLNLGFALFLFDLNPQTLSRWTILSLTWSLEGAMLHCAGRRSGPRESVYIGLACLGLAAVFTCGAFQDNGSRVASQFLIAGLILGGAFLHSAWASLAFGCENPDSPQSTRPLAILGLAVWAMVPGLEYFRLMWQGNGLYALNWLTVVWSLLAFALWLLTRRAPRLLAISLISRNEAKQGAPLLVAARLAVFTVFIGHLPGLLGSYVGMAEKLMGASDLLFQAIALALFFVSQALAIHQARRYRPAPLWSNLWGSLLLLSLGWLLGDAAHNLSLPAPLPGLARLTVALAVLGLYIRPPKNWAEHFQANFPAPTVCLCAAIALWHFAAMVGNPARTAWLPYLPLVNITDIFQALAAILPLAALHKMTRGSYRPMGQFLIYALGILLFIWLNLVLGRAMHHYALLPYHYEALFRNSTFQSLAALVWGAVGIAAMINGHRAARRPQWLLGAALLVADLAKIFFIDLSKVSTVARIVSFLAVGTVLILVGYFAPLPPAAREDSEEA